MLAHAVVPEGDRACLPAEAALDLDVPCGLVEMVEQPCALVLREAFDMAGEAGIDVDRPLARFGMRADHRMAHRRVLLVQFLGALAEPLGEDARDIVHRRQPFTESLHLVRQALVGEVHVCKQRIAAAFGHLARQQDRAKRGALAPGDVRMPVVLLPAALGAMRDAQHLGVGLVLWRGRMDLEIAEMAREGDVLRAGYVLVAEEDHAVLEQRRADFRNARLDVGCANIDSVDFRPDRRRHRPDVERSRVQGSLVSNGGHVSLPWQGRLYLAVLAVQIGIAQVEFLDLSRARHRKVADFDPFRRGLLRCDDCSQVGLESIGVHVPAFDRFDEGNRYLAPLFVRYSHDSDLGDIGMLENRVLDLDREEVLTPANDHLLHPAGYLHVAARIHRPQIAGMHPAVRIDRLRSGFGIVAPQIRRIVGENRTVTDLTSAEVKEIVGGYYTVKAKNFDEVQEIAKDYPDYDLGGTVEIREIMVFDR